MDSPTGKRDNSFAYERIVSFSIGLSLVTYTHSNKMHTPIECMLNKPI